MAKEAAENTVKKVVGVYRKDYGDRTISYGGFFADEERIPTGIFELDLALGGGFPRSRWITLYGRESSNKTNIALKAIANHQRLWPEKTCVYMDVEHTYDRKWATKLGVDVDSLVVSEPAYAEKIIDIFEGLCATTDIGLIVVDSLAAMVTTQEADTDATNNRVGGASLIIGKFVRKAVYAMAEANRSEVYPTLICINQLRDAMATNKYQEQDKMSGGKAPLFAASLIVKTYAKPLNNPKISKVLPYAKETSITIKKNKIPVLAMNAKFDFVLIPHDSLTIGQSDDFKSIRAYLEQLGHFTVTKGKPGCVMLDTHYPTIEDAREKLYSDAEFGKEVREGVIAAMKEEGIELDETEIDAVE